MPQSFICNNLQNFNISHLKEMVACVTKLIVTTDKINVTHAAVSHLLSLPLSHQRLEDPGDRSPHKAPPEGITHIHTFDIVQTRVAFHKSIEEVYWLLNCSETAPWYERTIDVYYH